MASEEAQLGYKKSLFLGNIGDTFDCNICRNVLKGPKQCNKCGRLYCEGCLNTMKKNIGFASCLQCDNQSFIVPDAKYIETHLNLEVTCRCGEIFALKNYENHNCKANKCKNFKLCKDYVNVQFEDEQVCSVSCLLQINLQIVGKDDFKQRIEIIKIFTKLEKGEIINGQICNSGKSINNNNASTFQNMYGVTPQQHQQQNLIKEQPLQYNQQHQLQQQPLCWNINFRGSNIALSNNNQTCILNEQQYVFKTVLANTGFSQGEHYWEIHPLQMTENELKVGVSTSQNFSPDTAFSDFPNGFSYYLTGSLRHGSNSKGGQYGVRIKNSGVLGCYLNMNNGTLSFAYNGRFLGVAYQDPKLKVGNLVYPAVSLLHKAGCSIFYNSNIPQYFK